MKAKMELTIDIDMDYENRHGEEVAPDYVEDQFRRAINKAVHNQIVANEDFHFWTMEEFINLTGFDDVDEVQDLGSMTLELTKLEEVKE